MIFEIGSLYVIQAGLKLTILLPQSPSLKMVNFYIMCIAKKTCL